MEVMVGIQEYIAAVWIVYHWILSVYLQNL